MAMARRVELAEHFITDYGNFSVRGSVNSNAALNRPGPPGGGWAAFAFPIGNRFCVALLYGRAGRVTAQTGGLRPGQLTC